MERERKGRGRGRSSRGSIQTLVFGSRPRYMLSNLATWLIGVRIPVKLGHGHKDDPGHVPHLPHESLSLVWGSASLKLCGNTSLKCALQRY